MSKRLTSKLVCVLILALGLAISGCGKPWQEPGPDATFETFLLDLYRGERKSAFESLRREDRERLTKALEELESEMPEEALPERTQMLVTGRVDNPYDLKEIEYDKDLSQEPEKGEAVELELIYHDGRKGSARVVWGGDRWYVDLPEATQVAEKPSEPSDSEKASERGASVANALVERLEQHVSKREAEGGSGGTERARDPNGDQ